VLSAVPDDALEAITDGAARPRECTADESAVPAVSDTPLSEVSGLLFL